MASARLWTVGTIAVLSVATASSAVSTLRSTRLRGQASSGLARLHTFGGRSAQQRSSVTAGKFDAALADLSRHAVLARPSSLLADLHALNPAARFKVAADGVTPLIAIDAITRGDPQQLKNALEALGLQSAAVHSNDVGGWLPLAQLAAAAARAEVHSLRAVMSRTRTGAVTSQGDFAQHSDALRSTYSLTGSGVTVGVLSDSYDCYSVYAQAGSGVPASGAAGYASNGFLATAATDVASGDLPSGVQVLVEADCLHYDAPTYLPFADEGRALLQVVHDVAPGAGLAFYAVGSEADFGNGIDALVNAGATVVADDIGYFDEPFFQDGLIAQAIDAVEAKGIAYFSAAGNDGTLAYENTAPVFGTPSSGAPNANEYLLNFDSSGSTTATALPITIAALQPGEYVAVVVEWDQPYLTGSPGSPGATSRIDLCITGAAGNDYIVDNSGNPVTCTGANGTGSDPVQILTIGNLASAAGNTSAETVNVVIGLADGTPAPGRIKIAVEDNGAGSTINAFPAASATATLQGHPGAAGAAAVGAAFYADTPACGTSPATLETFSSAGGAPILFDVAGNRLATPLIRQKPDFVGPDGGNDTFLGFTLASAGYPGGQVRTSIAACQNNTQYPNFFGTSAATPHVAAIAALMLQHSPAATPTQIYAALRSSALAMGAGSGFNFNSGYGFVQADAAMALLSPAPTTPTTPTTVASPSPPSSGGGSLETGNLSLLGLWVLASRVARVTCRRRSRHEQSASRKRSVPRCPRGRTCADPVPR
jgi:hypothetical protein